MRGRHKQLSCTEETDLQEQIDELERANGELRGREEEYRTLVDNISVGIFRAPVDERLPFVRANVALAHTLGYGSAAEMLSVRPADLYADPNDRASLMAELRRCGTVEDRRVRMRRRDGSTIVCSNTLSLVRGVGDEAGYVDGVLRDITDQVRTEDELRDSEGKYRQLVDSAQEGIWAVDKEFKTTFVNNSVVKMLGYPPEEVVGRPMSAFMDEAGKAKVRGLLARQKLGMHEVHDLEFVRKDGTKVYTRISTSVLMDHSGRFAGGMALVSDITARKEAEDALRLSETRFRTLAESTFESVVIHAEGKILDVNKAALELTGYTRDEVIGRSILDFFTPESQEVIKEAVRRPVVEAYEAHLLVKSGEQRMVQIRARIMDFQGRSARVATIMDVTEQVEARRRIEELVARKEYERQRLQTILDTLPVGVIIVDPSGRVTQNNDRAREIWDVYSRARPKDMSEYGSLRGWWADTGIALKAEDWTIARAMREGRAVVGDVIDVERQDGGRGTVFNSAAPILDQGRVVGGVIVTEDITKQRELEHDAVEAKRRAELYIDLLTHDINNMNTAAKGFLQMVESKSDLDAKNKGRLRKCREALDDVSELIEKVKKIQRIEGTDAKRDLVDIGWAIEDVVQSFRDYPGKDVTINYRPQLRRMVMANELITDVFSNLIGNAVKHSEGPVTVDITIGKTFEDGREYHVVTVEDNGPGVPDEAKKRIFSRLQRGKTRASGSGLGLYLVRSLVEDVHGRVWVEDRVPGDPSKGAKFVVLLPVAALPNAPQQ